MIKGIKVFYTKTAALSAAVIACLYFVFPAKSGKPPVAVVKLLFGSFIEFHIVVFLHYYQQAAVAFYLGNDALCLIILLRYGQ